MKKYEFLLLSQAGYIESNASLKSSALSLALYAATNSLLVPVMKLYHPIGGDVFEITTFQRSIHQFNSDYNMLSIVQAIGILLCFGCVHTYYENVGDAFAATACDDESLQAIIQTFENEKNYIHRIKNIQNELTKRQNKNA